MEQERPQSPDRGALNDRAWRLAENQRLIREANLEIKQEADALLAHAGESFLKARDEYELELFCACGRSACDEKLLISLGEYEEIHSRPHRFVVVPEHADPRVDRVLREGAGFVVVEKRPPYRVPDPTDG